MSSLNSQYLNSGDMIKLPQHTYIYTAVSLKPRQLTKPTCGFIVESRDKDFYKILLEEEYWYVHKDDVSWMGA